ncbi:MAG: GNAT family N-acetyltransferase [Actinomycetota bacterium]|nr:GNAT family N-acetyltransferase [Actinomycetota bacterium]
MDTLVPVPRALTWATHVDVLPRDRELSRREGCTVIRSPSNPRHWWGNLLLFDEAPTPGERPSWEQRFAAEFAPDREVQHVTLAWDQTTGEVGAAAEFMRGGYTLEETVALICTPGELRPHPRADQTVRIRALDPSPGADLGLWDQVTDVQADDRSAEEPRAARAFVEQRMADLRELFRDGRGAWYAALAGGRVVAGCGIVVTAGRGRYQSVDTLGSFRRRGICSRLVVAAGHHAAEHYGAQRLVICADVHYHALGLYESLGFARAEHTAGVCLPPAR